MKKRLMTILIALFLCFTTISAAFAEENVTLTIDSEVSDETVVVSGKVLKGELAGKGTAPFLQVFDNNNNLKETYQWDDSGIGTDGSISTTIKTKYYTNGEYTIKITAKGATPYKTTFSKTNGKPSEGSGNDSGSETPKTPVIPTPDPIPGTPTPKPDPNPINPDPVKPSPDPDPTVKPNKPKVNTVTSESLKITGTADPNTIVRITDKQGFAETTVTNSDGTFSITLSEKLKAKTILYAIAKAGDITSTEVPVIVIDKTPPVKPKVNKVSDKDTKVTGTTESGATVIVNLGSKLLGKGKADRQGEFSITIPKQKAGKYLSIIAIDADENSSEPTKSKIIDKTAPKEPSVNKVKKSSTKVTGKAEANAKVYVKVGKKTIGSSTVSNKGTFTVKIKKQKINTKLVVYVQDKAGNISKATIIKVTK